MGKVVTLNEEPDYEELQELLRVYDPDITIEWAKAVGDKLIRIYGLLLGVK